MWPSRRESARIARSRFSASPALRAPSDVRRSVSGTAWNASFSPRTATTVRQQPFSATLSPIRTSRGDLRARLDLELEALARGFEPRDPSDALDDSREHG